MFKPYALERFEPTIFFPMAEEMTTNTTPAGIAYSKGSNTYIERKEEDGSTIYT
jgi:hypothetical protein